MRSRFFHKDDAGPCDSRSRLLFLKRLGRISTLFPLERGAADQLKYKPHHCLSKIIVTIVSLPACAAIFDSPTL